MILAASIFCGSSKLTPTKAAIGDANIQLLHRKEEARRIPKYKQRFSQD
jgi:hypothetical protein